MDWASVAGILIAIGGILLGQALEGGRLGSLVQPAALLIVMMGTVGAVILQNGFDRFRRAMKMTSHVFSKDKVDEDALIREMAMWSATARREGLLSLERFINEVKDPFVSKGLRLVVDGFDPHKVREILDNDIDAYEMQERSVVKVWESAGGYAPTIGILGAVLGLIHVMENLSDPSKLGSGIAVAFVATIYGVGLANLVFLPIGGRLKTVVSTEVARRERLAQAFEGIASGDNPRLIEERMASRFDG
ncbi:MAG: motA2 [Paucimonas sp.]|jgi:chemotaxis protein MotA|nr:motA2 [Paucimonas sp.]